MKGPRTASVMSRALLALLIVSAAGCGILSPDGDGDELEDARERWALTRPVSYSFTVERLCFCGPEARGPVRLTVSGASITSQAYADGSDADGPATGFPDVDGLFDVIQDAIDRDAHSIEVTYDPTTGVPLDIWIDYQEFTIDEELGFRVVEVVQPIA